MAKTLAQMLEEDGPEDEPVIPPGLLDDEEKPEASPYASILGRPQEDDAPPVAARAPTSPPRSAMPTPRRGGPRDDLADAQAQDKEEQRRSRFEAGLDTIAFRKPFQPQQVGTPNADALTKRLGLERQGRQDDMQAFLNDARVKALLAKGDKAPKAPPVDKHAQKLDDDARAAGALSDFIVKSHGDELARRGIAPESLKGAPKEALEKLLTDLQGSRSQGGATERAHYGQAHADKRAEASQEIARQGLGLRGKALEHTFAAGDEVPGFEGSTPLAPGQKTQLSEAVAARNNIHGKVQEALAILERRKGVPFNPSDTDMAKLNLTMGELLPLLTTSSGMKSFTEGHADVFRHAMGDTRSLANFVNAGRLKAQLETLSHASDEAVRHMATSMQRTEVGAGGGHGGRTSVPPGLNLDAPPGGKTPGGGKVRILDPQGRPHRIDPSEVAEAEKHGWKRVQ